MELKQYISKLNLGSALCLNLFLFGIFLKLIISYFFSSDFTINYFSPFVEYFLNTGFSNPYEEFSTNSFEIFPYPSLMLLILSIPKILFDFGGLSIATSSFLIKTPLLIADITIFYVLKSLLNHRHTLRLIIIYWFSPVLIYISYIHGQLDIIPISLVFVSLFFLFRNALYLSAIFLAFSIATKTVIIAIIPILIIFLVSQRLPWLKVIQFLTITLVSFFIVNIQFIFSNDFLEMVFNNKQQAKVLIASIQFGSLNIYLLPIAYFAILLKGFSMRTLNKDLFVMFMGFSLAILLIFTNPNQGWYFWFLPFLMYFYVKAFNGVFLLFFLQVAYFIYFSLIENNDFFIINSDLYPLIHSNYKDAVISLSGLNESIISDLSFTLLQGLLIFNCFLIYNIGLNKYSNLKITSVPFLIGIGGNSGAGKSTFANALANIFSSKKSILLHGDDLHKWERGSSNWSQHTHLNPKANKLHNEIKILKDLINGKTILRSKYNHKTGQFDQPLQVKAQNLIFYEGLHPFFLDRQRKLFDLKIFLNPSSNLNSSWKIARDTQSRGKSENDVIKQINLREEDSKSFIKTQLKFADITIEPILRDGLDSQNIDNISYKIIFSNSLYLDEIIERCAEEPGIKITHDFLDETHQSIYIDGMITTNQLQLIADEMVEGLQELGISKPIWPANAFGVVILFLTYLIFSEAENE